MAGRGQAGAIGAEGDANDLILVPGEGEQLPPGRGVPCLGRPIIAGGGQAGAIGAEGDANDLILVPGEGEQLRPDEASHTLAVRSWLVVARRVPSGLKATPTTSSLCPVRVSSSRPAGVSTPSRPIAGRGQAGAIGAEGDAKDQSGVAGEGEQLPPGRASHTLAV